MAAPTRIVKGNASANIYITNGITKRLLSEVGSETVDEQIAAFLLAGLTEQNGSSPFVMDQDTVNAIVTV